MIGQCSGPLVGHVVGVVVRRHCGARRVVVVGHRDVVVGGRVRFGAGRAVLGAGDVARVAPGRRAGRDVGRAVIGVGRGRVVHRAARAVVRRVVGGVVGIRADVATIRVGERVLRGAVEPVGPGERVVEARVRYRLLPGVGLAGLGVRVGRVIGRRHVRAACIAVDQCIRTGCREPEGCGGAYPNGETACES